MGYLEDALGLILLVAWALGLLLLSAAGLRAWLRYEAGTWWYPGAIVLGVLGLAALGAVGTFGPPPAPPSPAELRQKMLDVDRDYRDGLISLALRDAIVRGLRDLERPAP